MNENENAIAEETLHDSLKALIYEKNDAVIKEIIDSVYPIDIAIASEDLEDDEIIYLFNLLNDEQIALILEQSNEDLQEAMMSVLHNDRCLKIFSFMSKDDIVDILGNLPIYRRKELINLMRSGEQKIIQELLGYDENTAGGIMTTEYIAVDTSYTIEQTIKKIKEIAPKTEVIDTIYVLSNKKELVGTVALRDILVGSYEENIQSIMNDNVISVEPETDQEDVSHIVSKYDLHAIPVVNKKNALLGIITVDDIIDVIVEEHTEDLLHLGGVSKEESVSSGLFESVRFRLPWLVINLFTAFLAAFVVSLFEGTIQQVVALASAMPIVAGMGGNAGTQSLSIVVRSIALGEVKLKDSWKMLIKEICLGLINGAVVGIITGIVLYFMYGSLYLGIIIFVSMVGNLIIAGISGFLVPLILKACHADPAVASSIFVTTATDVGGFFIFLGLSQIFLPYLV